MSIWTVVTPATTYDLTTLDVVKQRFGITTTDNDANLSAYISDASAAIADDLKRVLGEETIQEEFSSQTDWYGADGRDIFRSTFGTWGYQQLVLLRRPVSSIASVLDEAGNALDPSLYVVTADAGILRISNARPRQVSYDPLWPHGKITVEYTAGYALPDEAPRPLARACIKLIQHYRMSETRDPYVKSLEVMGIDRHDYWVGAIGDNGAFPPEVTDLIAPYRDIAA